MSDKIAAGMQQKSLCLFGAGGHGRVVASQIKRQHELALCFGDAALHPGDEIDGIKVNFCSIPDVTDYQLIITIGNNAIRQRLQNSAEATGQTIVHFISDDAHYFAAPPKTGTQVLSGALVNTGAEIGAGVIINSGAIVEHDSIIGNYCHLAPGSVVCGGVNLGENVLMGANATVLPGVSIASNCIIGAGAVVTQNILTTGIYIGAPAKPVKKDIEFPNA